VKGFMSEQKSKTPTPRTDAARVTLYYPSSEGGLIYASDPCEAVPIEVARRFEAELAEAKAANAAEWRRGMTDAAKIADESVDGAVASMRILKARDEKVTI